MRISGLVDRLKTHAKDQGYNLWYGPKDVYNTKRVITDHEVILEPFELYLELPQGKCYVDTTITLWLGCRREIFTKSTKQEDGQTTDFIDYMLSEASQMFDRIKDDDRILVTKNKFNIPVQYFEHDGGTTVNNQAFVKMVIPIRYHKEKDIVI